MTSEHRKQVRAARLAAKAKRSTPRERSSLGGKCRSGDAANFLPTFSGEEIPVDPQDPESLTRNLEKIQD